MTDELAYTNEEWRPVVGWEGFYEVSNYGRFRSLDRVSSNGRRHTGRMIGTRPVNGYLHACLCRPGQQSQYLAHRLVAAAFIGQCPPGHTVNHRDGDKQNNHISNLEYMTPSQQMRHARAVCGYVSVRGKQHPSTTLSDGKVMLLREMYRSGVYTQQDLDAIFGISQTAVGRILDRTNWKHISDLCPDLPRKMHGYVRRAGIGAGSRSAKRVA